MSSKDILTVHYLQTPSQCCSEFAGSLRRKGGVLLINSDEITSITMMCDKGLEQVPSYGQRAGDEYLMRAREPSLPTAPGEVTLELSPKQMPQRADDTSTGAVMQVKTATCTLSESQARSLTGREDFEPFRLSSIKWQIDVLAVDEDTATEGNYVLSGDVKDLRSFPTAINGTE